MKGKYLITTEQWFYAPDGLKYKAAWGNVEIVPDTLLGIKTNARSTNWYAKIGSEKHHIVVAGCQIHYAVRCEQMPNNDSVEEMQYSTTEANTFTRPSEIYIAE